MASGTRKITIEILGDSKSLTAATSRVSKELGGLDAKVGKLSGAFGLSNAKAGALSAAMGVGGGGLAAGLTAVGVGVVSAVNKFKDLAIQSDKLADATGLTVEQSSRWIEVAGDMGVSAGSLETALGKMAKTLGGSPELFDRYGVAIARAKDGSVDMNATFLNVVDTLNAIPDPARRAKVASDLLGRGWQDVADLVAEGSAGLADSLAKVSDAKVITAEEVKDAEDYREATQELGDAFEDLVITLGQKLAPALSRIATRTAEIVEKAAPLIGLVDEVTQGVSGPSGLNASTEEFVRQWNLAHGMTMDFATDALSLIPQISKEFAVAASGVGGLSDEFIEMQKAADLARIEKAAASVAEMGGAAMQAKLAINGVERAWDALTGALSDDNALLDVQDAFDNLTDTVFPNTEQGIRDMRRATNDLKLEVADYGREVLGLPEEQVTEFLAEIDKGNYYWVEQQLALLARNRTMRISIETRGGVGDGYGDGTGRKATGPHRAAGGWVRRNETVMVGERGPEPFSPARSGYVTANNAASAGPTVIQLVVDGRVLTEVVHDGLLRKKRTGGSLQLT